MKALSLITVLMAGSFAMADGFNCTSESGLNIKVYNHTQAAAGTRSAAVMVISDSAVGAGNKTIAKFEDVTGLLKSSQQVYTAKVDLRFSNSSRKGELIGGTKLGQLASIELAVDFTYARPVANTEEMEAILTLEKRNGEVLTEAVNCARYLKN